MMRSLGYANALMYLPTGCWDFPIEKKGVRLYEEHKEDVYRTRALCFHQEL